MNKIRSTKGITLVALIITIIILIILVAVGIKGLVDTGIIKLASDSTVDYAEKQQKEIEEFDDLASNLDEALVEKNSHLPENTEETEAGTEVKLPDNWYSTVPAYVSTEDGSIVKKTVKVASVTAVAVGGGETVPVPKGFCYVGGTLDTGVIISDNEADKYDGTTDKTTFAYTTSLVGNQFVWIPCTTSAYTKTSWGKQNAGWDDTTPKSELSQIGKYGGFYVGRYEAGLASTIEEFTTTQTHTDSNQIYNLDGVPQSKAGLVPWNFVDWPHSKANAESMYNNNYVSSGLITGTQWDVILNTMKNKAGLSDSDITNSNSWGNHRANSLAYTGRLAKATYGSSWYLAPFGSATSGNTTAYSSSTKAGDLLTTGASSTTEKYHIFDIAGSLWEWTEEDSHYATTGQYRVYRGGSYAETSSDRPACYRGAGCAASSTHILIGFRAVLYIK